MVPSVLYLWSLPERFFGVALGVDGDLRPLGMVPGITRNSSSRSEPRTGYGSKCQRRPRLVAAVADSVAVDSDPVWSSRAQQPTPKLSLRGRRGFVLLLPQLHWDTVFTGGQYFRDGMVARCRSLATAPHFLSTVPSTIRETTTTTAIFQ